MKWKSTFVFVLVVVTGAVIGGLVAQLVRDVSWLSWLAYGASFGVSNQAPFVLDLAVLKLTFGLMLDINIATILGIIAALLIYKRLV